MRAVWAAAAAALVLVALAGSSSGCAVAPTDPLGPGDYSFVLNTDDGRTRQEKLRESLRERKRERERLLGAKA